MSITEHKSLDRFRLSGGVTRYVLCVVSVSGCLSLKVDPEIRAWIPYILTFYPIYSNSYGLGKGFTALSVNVALFGGVVLCTRPICLVDVSTCGPGLSPPWIVPWGSRGTRGFLLGCLPRSGYRWADLGVDAIFLHAFFDGTEWR